jgi:hypothetical protein
MKFDYQNIYFWSDIHYGHDHRSPHEVVNRHCAHIQKPYTLEEILEQVASSKYNSELMLQHLLLWVSNNDQGERLMEAK